MLGLNNKITTHKSTAAKPTLQHKLKRSNNQQSHQFNLQALLQLEEYNNSHKEDAIRFVEQKSMISFKQRIKDSDIRLIKINKPKVIDKCFDSSQKSYYLLSGTLQLRENKRPNTRDASTISLPSQMQEYFRSMFQQFRIQDPDPHSNHEVYLITQQMGVGCLFTRLHYANIEISAQSGLLLKIRHGSHNLQRQMIQGHLLSPKQKQQIIKQITIFQPIVNFSKLYSHNFKIHKFRKGQFVYQINDESQQFYIIAEGSVQFQSKIESKQLQGRLLNRRNNSSGLVDRNLSIVTETLNRYNYFGEEEMLRKTKRLQNARCQSLQCLTLALHLEVFQKLLLLPQFRGNLQEMATHKHLYRQQTIQSFLSLKHHHKTTQKQLATNDFANFKKSIFQLLSSPNRYQQDHSDQPYDHNNDHRQQNSHKISLLSKKKNVRILHNNEIETINIAGNMKDQSFFMLDINKPMYEHTLKRFRLNLQQIQKMKEPTVKQQSKGRTLEDIWNALNLQKSIDLNRNRIRIRNSSGLKYYNAHNKIKAKLKCSKSLKPRSLAREFMPRVDKRHQSQLMI